MKICCTTNLMILFCLISVSVKYENCISSMDRRSTNEMRRIADPRATKSSDGMSSNTRVPLAYVGYCST